MQIDEATVRHIARLARIKIGKKEAANLERELSAILDWVDQLGEVDTDNVAPLTRIGDMKLPWRADEVTAGGCPEDILRDAPLTEDGFFVVPKVVE
jgi:aspartyl-tRNA(Asn)/glutamyl-tRNA(Gln) amidotransferase subunit C